MSLQRIPFIVHQTFYTSNLPLEIVEIVQHNKRLCPRYKFVFYDDEQCETFIKTHFEERIYNAYLALNKKFGAMKADFFRYCVLYKMGGVYLDIKSKILKPLGEIIKPNDVCLLDVPRTNLEPWRTNMPTYEQWVLMFAPNHPYLKEMIDQMVDNIEKRYEPKILGYNILTPKQKVLMLTGPDALARAINTCISNNQKYHRNIDYNRFFNRATCDYIKMYKGRKHYSKVNESLYN